MVDDRETGAVSDVIGRALVITASNRAATGVYADRGGPILAAGLQSWGFAVDGPLVVADATPRAVREGLQKLLEWFKVPDDIVVVDRLPLNRNGKVDAVAVRALRPSGRRR